MVHSIRFKSGTRKVSPPNPTFMDDDQLAHYLKDLRNNRPPRPIGSRPLPTKDTALLGSPQNNDLPPRASSALSMSRPADPSGPATGDLFPRSSSALSHRRYMSELLQQNEPGEYTSIPEETVDETPRNTSSTPMVSSPNAQYRESGHRWVEKRAARSLRNALEEMDLQDEEQRLYDAAHEEAVDLVLQHQKYGFQEENPHAPYRNPDVANRFLRYSEKGGHFRSHSSAIPRSERDLSESDSSGGSNSANSHRISFPAEVHGTRPQTHHDNSTFRVKKNSCLRRTSKVNFSLPEDDMQQAPHPQLSRISNSDSSKGLFRNPEDQIYEEPEDPSTKAEAATDKFIPSALRVKARNSLPRGARSLPRQANNRAGSEKKLSIFDIHKNPPTQSKNPFYKANNFSTTANSTKEQETSPTKDGIEIRSEEIRAATSMRLKDRSSRLPMPSAVSDRPGRPIVSFDPDWKAPEEEAYANSRGARQGFGQSSSRPSIENTSTPHKDLAPTINVSEAPSVPSISVECEDSTAPSIVISELGPPISSMPPQSEPKRRELPDPKKYAAEQRSKKAAALSKNRFSHITPTSINFPTAACAACGLPISGRIVTACDHRLHPECFTCYHCSTALECVAFYQEPESSRAERLAGSDDDDQEMNYPRFYCHLDFHELFSPRCKSCKTPIEGEVIVACGAEWHVGHFFCAECGDPFTPETPFVEKEGYAWCVRCHSRRTADKCRACKLPVVEDVVVTALGGQWHEKCFVCCECGGGFGPEGRFFARQGKPRVTAKGRQIGGPVETAACESCEARRLKA
ncbi:LIM domain-containing protein [Coccidioides immitis RS]|uniref:LIM domain-containing protein n=2 Tax=Coccidioides immitis TaxID=5501 RepID=A0A0E1RX24_COCIM|nr:LIM domain-containing protein [Coccidioides immitis RS]EAS31612.2 LIM domain-containing protein [Coccidioides immitis RS]KMP04263.1 leupaxin [Coccidioides immitis RMSCC 2394]